MSVCTEVIAQCGYLSITAATALAPLVAYVVAVGGLKSIILVMLLFFFPIHKRSEITKSQWIAILLIVLGVFVIEVWR